MDKDIRFQAVMEQRAGIVSLTPQTSARFQAYKVDVQAAASGEPGNAGSSGNEKEDQYGEFDLTKDAKLKLTKLRYSPCP